MARVTLPLESRWAGEGVLAGKQTHAQAPWPRSKRKGSWPAELWDSLRGWRVARTWPPRSCTDPPPRVPPQPRPFGTRCAREGASKGQVWTRHLAPAAPASRPSLPTQFHDCACHADSALQFLSLPSALSRASAGVRLSGSRLCRRCGLTSGRSGVLVSHFGLHLSTAMLAVAGPTWPHTPPPPLSKHRQRHRKWRFHRVVVLG